MPTPRAPLKLMETRVEALFLDYNGHMNDAAYAGVFSRSVDAFTEQMGLDAAGRAATGRTIYTLAVMIHYLREARLGEPLLVYGQLLEQDEKRYRLWMEMRSATDALLAASEHLIVCVDQSGAAPRIAPFPPPVLARIEATARAHAGLPVDERAGRGVSLRRR
ncbi:MAG: thioesterase family protein [Rhizobiales bacterium]|nr:thioesterase family protein [Hyphomicrobiales bacterium]